MPSSNGLTSAEEERLIMLQEEAIEVAKACSKILRHGYHATDGNGVTYDNEADLNDEINQFLAIRSRMYDRGDMKSKIPNLNQIWRDKLRYTYFQKEE